MINYILQVILFQVLFLAIYDFFLSKETFFTKNRWYLISTPLLSFLIPLIKIPSFQKAVPKEYVVNLPEIVLSPERVIQRTIETTSFQESVNYVAILFWLGVGVFSMLFLLKLVKIINLIVKHNPEKHPDFTLIVLPNQSKAFSFFNYIFLGKDIPTSQKNKIIQHELVHSKQKHSLDLLLFEFLKIVMWFNPMIYFYQKRITLVHEYISDAVVSKSETKEMYINNLLSSFFQVENIAFINQFYKKSFIKQRILMMKKVESKSLNQLKYLVLIPVLVSMLFYSSCAENISDTEIASKKQLQTKYRNSNGKLVSFEGYDMTHLDDYLGDIPPKEVIEISFKDLASYEKEEFNKYLQKTKEYFRDKPEILKSLNFKFFKMPNGRKAYGTIEKGLNFNGKDKTITETEEVSSTIIEQAPTFPGCEDGDKDCFREKLQEHFKNNMFKK